MLSEYLDTIFWDYLTLLKNFFIPAKTIFSGFIRKCKIVFLNITNCVVVLY